MDILEHLEDVIRDRRERLPEGSYTAHLFREGQDEILKKLGEEATEVILASKGGDKGQIVYEAADLVYHLLVLLAYHGLGLEDVLAELEGRFKTRSLSESYERMHNNKYSKTPQASRNEGSLRKTWKNAQLKASQNFERKRRDPSFGETSHLRRALLSVSDKRGIVEFARGLEELRFEIVSTGGTAKTLRQAGIAVRGVEEVTAFPEILDGRVKTLHPAIHGGILARRDESHLAELEAHGINPIDLVAVNLYPFAETIAEPGTTLAEAIEQIDIGGVALLRAAAKNFLPVVVVSEPADYSTLLEELRQRDDVSLKTRRRLALKAFHCTASYDIAISRYLSSLFEGEEPLPPRLQLDLSKLKDLRYGENPHQRAAFYSASGAEGPLGGTLLQGKELSYNNILDLDAAWRLVSDFAAPTLAIIKHGNPCGVASTDDLASAFRAALASDPISAFGSILAANRPFDGAVASALGDLFVEAIAAPAFTAEARKTLARRPNCRLVEMASGDEGLLWEVRSVRGGLLLQERDTAIEDEKNWRVVTERKPTPKELKALSFAWRVVKHVKSNAIVLAKETATVGIGAGQMSRLDAVRLAIAKAGEGARGSVLASDAFFPFPDGVEEAAQAGATAIVQPGGSRRDADVIKAANDFGLAMLFTGVRHFRH